MALPARPMHVPAALPIDEVTRVEWLDVGKANRANINVRANERGALEHRLGFASLAKTRIGASDRSAGRRLFSHFGAPTVIDDTHIDSYLESAGTNTTRSRVPGCTYRILGLPSPTASSTIYDTEYCNGYVAVTSNTSIVATNKVAIVDATTGVVVRSPETIGGGSGFAFVGSFSSRYFVVFVYVASSTAITAHILDTLAIASGWSSLATVAATTGGAVPVPCSLSNRVAVAYGTNSGTDRLTVKTFNQTGLLETRTINTNSQTPTLVSIDGSIAGTLWVAWHEGTTVRACGISGAALATTLATTGDILTVPILIEILNICEGSTAGTARLNASDATSIQMRMASIATTAGAAVAGVAYTVYNCVPSSRPFVQGGRYYMAAYGGATNCDLDGNRQASCIFVDWTDDVQYVRPVANIEPGLVSVPAPFGKVSAVSATKRVYGFAGIKSGKTDIISLTLGTGATAHQLLELDFGSRARWQTVEHAGNTFLGGAILSVYDGERVTESGFVTRPTKPTTALSGTGITGTFRYVAIYEDIDAYGNWVVSGISEASASVSPANQTVTVSVAPLSISSRIAKGTVRVAIYRTATGGEPPYYRLTAIANDTTAGAVTYADAVADATLIARAKLYAPTLPGTAGEAQDRRAPPGLPRLVSYNGMLVGAKGSSLFYSGQEVYGEATWHSSAFEVPISSGGDIVALYVMDGTVFIWKHDRIFAIAGEPPSDNGQIGGLGAPRLVSSDVGCSEPDSLVATSLGIFFRSARGIELLSRSQTVEWVGDAVQTTLATYPILTSAVLDERNALVRFTLAAAESAGAVSGNGRTLVFDLGTRSWISTDDVRGSVASQSAQSAAIIYFGSQWRYAWLGTDGTIYYERNDDDAIAYLDGSTFVTAQYELAPWKLGLQQEQRIYEMEMLFKRDSAAGLTIEVANDYGAYVVADQKVWTESAIATARQVSFRPNPLSTAIQLRVKDTAPAVLGNGKGLTFIGISADIAPKQGTTRGTPRLDPSLRR